MRKIDPGTPMKEFVQQLTPWENEKSFNAERTLCKKRLFAEENYQAKPKFKMFFVTTIFPLLAVGVYAVLTGIENFNLFTAIGIFTAVALLCFCSMNLIESDDKQRNTEEKGVFAKADMIHVGGKIYEL